MELTINKSDVYYISGKIINIDADRGIFTISVTSPFTCEIEFHCESGHYYLLHPVSSMYEGPSRYNWMNLQIAHPDVTEASAYYNKKNKCFYKREAGTESEWISADFEDIYYDNPNLFKKSLNSRWLAKYFFFLRRYRSVLHKEQLCEFSAYALHENRSVQSPQVKRHPDDYYWIYDPDTFEAKKWDTESIDNLVKEIRPSREAIKHLSKSYEEDDRKAKKEWWKRKWQGVKSIPKRVEDSIGKYPRLLWLILTLGIFFVGIGSLIVTYLKD